MRRQAKAPSGWVCVDAGRMWYGQGQGLVAHRLGCGGVRAKGGPGVRGKRRTNCRADAGGARSAVSKEPTNSCTDRCRSIFQRTGRCRLPLPPHPWPRVAAKTCGRPPQHRAVRPLPPAGNGGAPSDLRGASPAALRALLRRARRRDVRRAALRRGTAASRPETRRDAGPGSGSGGLRSEAVRSDGAENGAAMRGAEASDRALETSAWRRGT